MREKINDDLKTAMKAGEKDRVGTLRLINAAIKSADIDARPSGKDKVDEAGVLAVLAKMIKQRRDSIEQFVAGGRQELADKEAAEIKVIEAYLPKQMDVAEAQGRHRRRDQGGRRREPEGHGQGDGGAEGPLCRPDGLRQGERGGEGAAQVNCAAVSSSGFVPRIEIAATS